MTSSFGTMLLVLAISTAGGHREKGWKNVLPPGPGYGWGYANGAPDGYGHFDMGYNLPLHDGRVSEYFFPRHFALPPEQLFFPQYYNPYQMRGQRYIPYSGMGGPHDLGRPPAPSLTPVHPYQETLGSTPRRPLPVLNGRVEAPPVNTGGTGLRP